MKIVITDGYTLNPGDLTWKPFDELGEVIYHDRTPDDKIAERCRAAHVIITNKTPISESVIGAANNLKLISVTATGYNIVDTAAAKKKGVVVCNVPEYGTYSVAQHTMALMLELTNRVGKHEQSVREGVWVKSPDWSYAKYPVIELMDKTLGIIGMGRIGQQTAKIAQALGMNVVYYGGKTSLSKTRQVTLQQLFSESDFISVHCPLKSDNHSFINKELISLMKPTAFLINTSRGQLIHEQDLAEALNNKILAGAALDVLSKEPPPENHPLLGLPNCLITPHNAWLSLEARQRIMNTTLENVKKALSGKAQNVVA